MIDWVRRRRAEHEYVVLTALHQMREATQQELVDALDLNTRIVRKTLQRLGRKGDIDFSLDRVTHQPDGGFTAELVYRLQR